MGDVAKIGTGATPLTSNLDYYENGSIPWVTSAATSNEFITKPTSLITQKAVNETNCTVYPIGTLVIAMYGEGKTRGQISELGIEAATNQACATIVPLIPEVYNKRYIKACFNKNYEDLRIQAKGAQQPNLNLSIISDFFIPLPPLAEQRRIVAAIESAFAVIDEIERNKTDLQAAVTAAKSKILSIAIRGKLVPQDPADEPASVLLERVRAEREVLVKAGKIKRGKGDSVIEKSCDNSYYEKVPASWTWAAICDVCEQQETKLPAGETFRYIDIDAIDNKRHCVATPKIISTRQAPSRAAKGVCAGDTLFSMVRPYLENIAFITEDLTDCIASTGFYVCRPVLKVMFPKYLYFYMTFPHTINKINGFMRGDNSPSIRKDEMNSFPIPIPPLSEQRRIVEAIEVAFVQLDRIAESLN